MVGAGGSGLATAVSAAEHGLRVVLLEKQPNIGGTTGIAIGSLTANRTEYQRRAGVTDSLNDHCEDAGKFAKPPIEARNNVQLRNYFLSHTADTIDWLQQKGLSFHGPSPEPPNRVPRMHNVVPNAKAYIAVLQAELLRRGGVIHCETSVDALVEDAGRIMGVKALQQGGRHVEFYGTLGIALAAGDYTNSPDLISRHKGASYSEIEGINPTMHGDGHLLAESVGAKLVNMDITYGPELRFVPHQTRTNGLSRLFPTSGPPSRLMGRILPWVPKSLINAYIKRLLVTWQHPENALFDDGAILVNQAGERFCDETQSPDREIAVANQSDKIAYILLDYRLMERYSCWPHFISTAPNIAYAYCKDYLRLRPDVAIAGPLDTIAPQRGIPSRRIKQTVKQMTERVVQSTKPSVDGPWLILGPVKSYFTTTEGGAAIDFDFQVLREDGSVIKGLYAVGQNGLGGQILWGHGLHIAWAMTSGRLLGKLLGQPLQD